ncbi:helix-turn-helix domain-containing protein [Flexithrix dorotheae]|uniref:helix-turn-helix domain-containing protein n=1 Tax=Flexithrix dorotheae TaxID=70993 RepID=UPI00036AF0B9|nr:AraC family transcriptional regulator [Flexithrix dorotheae]
MEDYNKILESLTTKFLRSSYLDIIRSVNISNFYDFQNTLILIRNGTAKFGEDQENLNVGDILFIPGGKNTSLLLGKGEATKLSNEDFINQKENFLRSRNSTNNILTEEPEATLISVTFEVKAFDSVNFFPSLDIPPFSIKGQPVIGTLMSKINYEMVNDAPGKSRLINIYTDELVIELFRHILGKGMFLEQLATNSNYFKDPRLIEIFNYIKENLPGDLSNKTLANVANVSEDYVGQYFKMLTGINPQDYIEYQRMERAVTLLRTSKKSIRNIGVEVGYKDTAYFCRRFKMMFGIPAGKMRRRESLMDA